MACCNDRIPGAPMRGARTPSGNFCYQWERGAPRRTPPTMPRCYPLTQNPGVAPTQGPPPIPPINPLVWPFPTRGQ
jgi:hypothetical protein